MSFGIKSLLGLVAVIAVAMFLLVAAPRSVAVPLLVGSFDLQDFDELRKYVDHFAFSFRVWSCAAWIIAPIAGLCSMAAHRALRGGSPTGPSASGSTESAD